MRPWLARLAPGRGLEQLNRFAEESGVRTESGIPVRFVPPAAADPYYEMHLFETGRVQTRPGNWHDLFNALMWLAFPAAKARINAMHAAEIPREGGRRGRLRDMLTIFDEGGAIVVTGDAALADLIRRFRWRELFWEHRERARRNLRVVVFGHAVLEKALEPFPGITCKVVFADPGGNVDAQVAARLASGIGSPADLAPLPVFGLPGWHPENSRAAFYDDAGVFRGPPQARTGVKSRPGVGQAAAAPERSASEESPGSTERDAG